MLSAADPTWQLVLVGPLRVGDDVERRLRALPNLHLLGGKTVEELPAYLKALSVALIPYRLNELSRNIFPLKLFEYLAGGVPVVSAALPELERFRGIISLAASPAEYPMLVRQALDEDDAERRRGRVALAEQNSWDHRVDVIARLVVDTLARTEGGASAPAPSPGPSTAGLPTAAEEDEVAT